MKTGTQILYEGAHRLAKLAATWCAGNKTDARSRALWAVTYDRAYEHKLAEIKMRYTFERIGVKQ